MKKRVNISIAPEIKSLAAEVMKVRKYDGFSEFIEQLIREEHERRNGSAPNAAGVPSPEVDAILDALIQAAARRRRGPLPPA